MAIELNTIKHKVPIKRNNKFFGKEDFDLELNFSMEYMEQDMNQTIILYEVDLEKTKVNSVYKEATKESIRFKTPVEVPCIYEIQDAEMKPYDTKLVKGVYSKPGKLTFSVLIKTLEELKCDIKRGDYIRIDLTEELCYYWTVTNDGKVQSFANKNTMYGTKPYFRTIECSPIDKNEFSG